MTRSTADGGISRRALFALAGAGAALASVAALWRPRSPGAEAATPIREDAPIAYADYQGWMVTPAEKASLAAAPGPPSTAIPR
jgi:hypothetical protein